METEWKIAFYMLKKYASCLCNFTVFASDTGGVAMASSCDGGGLEANTVSFFLFGLGCGENEVEKWLRFSLFTHPP